MTDSRIPTDLIERQLAGETTPEEQVIVERWLSAHAQAEAVVDVLHEATAPVRQDAHVQWEALRSRISRKNVSHPPVDPALLSDQHAHREKRSTVGHDKRTPIARKNRTYHIVVGAAIGAFAIGFGMFRANAHHAETIHRTDRAEYVTITLPDSSRVTLAPESQLMVSGRFGHRDRFVTLKGEAYFDVTSSSSHPFQIQAATVVTRVLGTTFGVKYYDGDSAVRVVVNTGKVASGGQSSHAIISAGSAMLITDSTTTSLPSGNLQEYTSWVDGKLTFSDTPIPEMLATMGRWYGYTFKLADSALAKRHVTATFNVQSSQETLAEMARLLNVTMKREGTVIMLAPSSATSRTRVRQLEQMNILPRSQPGDRVANTLPGQVGR